MGLETVVDALPTHRLFYVIALVAYATPPLFEAVLYRRLLPPPTPGPLLMFRKRALNEAAIDYAGEIDLYVHMRGRPGAGALIKDNNLLSGLVSNSATVLLLLGLVVAGRLDILDIAGHAFPQLAAGAAAILAAVLTVVAVFHRRLLTTEPFARRIILRQQVLRLALGFALQVAQWAVALPTVPLTTWLLFLAVWMLATRIPFLPNRDLLLATIGLGLAKLVAAPQVTVAAMFVTGAALPLIGHVSVLILCAALPHRPPQS
jgi:hypothetical protein